MSTKQAAINRSVRRLLLVTVAMVGFGYAMVPFYSVFCKWTGMNGRTAAGPVSANLSYPVDEKRTVTVEFIANTNENLPWDFKPEVVKMQVHPGQAYTTRFYARNRAHDPMVGHAVPSVAPGIAAQHFKKTECFCFTEQRFAGGEGRWMPVRFMIDPELPADIGEVALSYTFFDTGKIAAAKTGLESIKSVAQTNSSASTQ